MGLNVSIPPTEIELAEALEENRKLCTNTTVWTIRRLAFQRDHLLQKLDSLSKKEDSRE